jgi:hypothetical protein
MTRCDIRSCVRVTRNPITTDSTINLGNPEIIETQVVSGRFGENLESGVCGDRNGVQSTLTAKYLSYRRGLSPL